MIGVRQKDIRHKLPHLHVQLKPRTHVLGHSQPSLRDCSCFQLLPRTPSWATLSRPFGTGSCCQLTPRTTSELLSVVPAGLARAINSPRRLAFFDRLIWTALAKNKSATRADRDPVPQGRLRIAQDV